MVVANDDFPPNSFVLQKEGAQEEEEAKEEAGDRRKGGQTGTPRPGVDAPQVHPAYGCRMRGTGETMDGGVGWSFTPQEGQRG